MLLYNIQQTDHKLHGTLDTKILMASQIPSAWTTMIFGYSSTARGEKLQI